MTDDIVYCKLLSGSPRAIAHLRSQVESKRFGLVLGAGISLDFNVPTWEELVNLIASDPAVDGAVLIEGEAAKKSLPYRSEMLFQRFRKRQLAETAEMSLIEQENSISAEWLKLCQRYIYGDVGFDLEKGLPNHPYFEDLVLLVRDSYLTINFNFDDFLERSLALRRPKDDQGSRGFEAVTDPWPQFRRTNSVIYHPHGYVPFGMMEGPVDRFVFSEAAYSKQYVGSHGHDASFLSTHFARNTCLLIGCSLEDELRNVLLRGAQINPGNYHYYIHYIDEGKSLDEEERLLIEETNFKVYNLITLFLSARDIGLLLKLINRTEVSDEKIKDLASICRTTVKFTYYMTGAIGVGKSTTTNLLRSLTVLDEWLEKRLDILGKPWDTLTPEEKKTADAWIADQFKKKNDSLRHQNKAVISVVDRPPLDPLVFTNESERPQKARSLLETICPSPEHKIEPGVVILLLGIPEELSARVRATGRSDYTSKKLEKMQKDMQDIYKEGQDGVVIIDTKFLTIPELTKMVAQIIHRDEYVPMDLMSVMKTHGEETSVAT